MNHLAAAPAESGVTQDNHRVKDKHDFTIVDKVKAHNSMGEERGQRGHISHLTGKGYSATKDAAMDADHGDCVYLQRFPIMAEEDAIAAEEKYDSGNNNNATHHALPPLDKHLYIVGVSVSGVPQMDRQSLARNARAPQIPPINEGEFFHGGHGATLASNNFVAIVAHNPLFYEQAPQRHRCVHI